jgi:aerobic carbon-monoxide dehydrogenase medium subunit
VKPAPFAYAKARSLDHAIELLGVHRGEARLLAGGQSLLAALNMRRDAPGTLIDINGIAGLDHISVADAVVEIGALVRHAQAERSPAVRKHLPLLARALPHIGHPAIRNRGTVGGSIALADPGAELPACLLALGGEVEIAAPGRRRRVGADDFFRDRFRTAIGAGEVLTAITLPAARPQTRVGFDEISRRHGDYAVVGLAASAQAEGDRLAGLRLAFFGVGSTPVRARRAEMVLSGAPVDAARIEAAVAALAEDLDPPDDVQMKGTTKRYLAGVVLRRVVGQLLEAPR